MKATSKLSGEERRAAIIKAVRRVFADKGFHGTTTRELATAAGVSEALLFKHFPNKEALYSAMLLSCGNEQDHDRMARISALPPSASTLVLLVHFLVSKIVGKGINREEEQIIQNRLVLRSLAEDGEFARVLVQRLATGWVPRVTECLEAAVKAGDARGPVVPGLAGWFTHHLAAMILVYLLPASPVVDYGVSHDQLVEEAVRFSLRGMGLEEESIQRLYNPQASPALQGGPTRSKPGEPG
jgi:AcrR family transcriptional regulator